MSRDYSAEAAHHHPVEEMVVEQTEPYFGHTADQYSLSTKKKMSWANIILKMFSRYMLHMQTFITSIIKNYRVPFDYPDDDLMTQLETCINVTPGLFQHLKN